MIKVSVVVPTYRSGDGLDRLVASLDAQTLPASEFEVIFVDDGSPDDTHERLLRIAAARPHVRVERIENSGWPCRPRNIGTDLACGEYVAYMDHDDLLYPDALRTAYEYAVANRADVVNGKEARTHDATWAIDTYRADLPQSIGRSDQHPLIPMNPHKLYRRAFLDEHGIRFREEGRVLWEDIFFNVRVAQHAEVISTMASTPYYHWYTTPGSGSHGFLRSTSPFWQWLREVFVAIDADLGDDAVAMQRRQLRLHQYRSRILGSFDGRFADRPAEHRDLIYEACRGLQADFGLGELNDELNRSAAIRAQLLRDDEQSLLTELPAHDPGIPGRVRLTAAHWIEGRLELSGVAEWVTSTGRRHALRRDGDALSKVLPVDYARRLPAALLDVTGEVRGAIAEFGVRSRESRVTWMLPSTSSVSIDGEGQDARFAASVAGVLDPDTAVFGRPLEHGVWDVNARCTLAGSIQQQRVQATVAASATLVGEELRLAYVNADGFLSVSLGPEDGRAVRHLTPDIDALSVTHEGGVARVALGLENLSVWREGVANTRVDVASASGLRRFASWVGRREPYRAVAAQLRGTADGALLEFVPGGTGRLRVRIGDLGGGPAWWVIDLREGAVRPGPIRERSGESRSKTPRRFRRRVGRVLRKLHLR